MFLEFQQFHLTEAKAAESRIMSEELVGLGINNFALSVLFCQNNNKTEL